MDKEANFFISDLHSVATILIQQHDTDLRYCFHAPFSASRLLYYLQVIGWEKSATRTALRSRHLHGMAISEMMNGTTEFHSSGHNQEEIKGMMEDYKTRRK